MAIDTSSWSVLQLLHCKTVTVWREHAEHASTFYIGKGPSLTIDHIQLAPVSIPYSPVSVELLQALLQQLYIIVEHIMFKL